MIGKSLSHYNIVSELGRGGMGIVYKATDTKLNRTVALKVLPATILADEDLRVRFYREARAGGKLNHPNICHVYQVDEVIRSDAPPGAAAEPFIAMEYVEGETVRDRLKKVQFTFGEAVSVAVQVAEALGAAHAENIMHRDIKPGNVIIRPDGVTKVLDFGLAKSFDATTQTRDGIAVGTVAYMSPEQAKGEHVDGRSDFFSLGLMLYEMVAGRLPFPVDYEQGILYHIIHDTPEPLSAIRTGVPPELERIVSKCLSKDVERRYQSATDLVSDLKGTQSGSARAISARPSTPVSSRGLSAVMFADMVGFTSLMGRDEGAAREQRDRQREVVGRLVEAHGGQVRQYYGDGTLSLFRSAVEGVRCSVAIQVELQEPPEVLLRIGIHIGDVVDEGDGVYGDGINVASRVESLAPVGGVAVSDKVFDEIKNHPDLPAISIGTASLKNVTRPVEIFALTGSGLPVPGSNHLERQQERPDEDIGATRSADGTVSPRRKRRLTWWSTASVAVILIALAWQTWGAWPFGQEPLRLAILPFQVTGGGQPSLIDQGLNSDLVTSMGRLPGLEVVRGRSIDFSEAASYASLINADYLLSGVIEGSGEDVQLKIDLHLPSDPIAIWQTSFARPVESAAEVQEEIVRAVTRSLGLELSEADLNRIGGVAVQREAEEAYLAGIAHVRRRTPRDHQLAIGLFETAVDIEPEFADAWAGLAHARMLSGGTAYSSNLATSYGLARTAANRALEIDPSQALALTTLASTASEFEWNTRRADSLFQLSLLANPNLAETYHLFASHLAESGRLERALELQWQAMQLEPELLIHPTNYAQLLFYDNRPVESLRYLDDVVSRAPRFYVALLTRSYPLMAMGRSDEALESLQRAEAITGPQHLISALRASAHGLAGRRDEALEELDALMTEADSTYVSAPLIAQVHIALGDTATALDFLEAGLRAHDVYMTVIGPWPFSDGIRDNPRFERILRAMDRYPPAG